MIDGRGMKASSNEASGLASRLPQDLGNLTLIALRLVHGVLAITPLLFYGAVFALSWRGQALTGQWPVGGIDYATRATHIAPGDTLYWLLGTVSAYLMLAACLSLPLMLVLTVVLARKRASIWPIALFLLYALGIALMKLDVGGRVGWLLG